MPKISALPAMTTADGNDPAPIVDDSATQTKKITLTKMKEWLQSLTSWIGVTNVNHDSWTHVRAYAGSLVSNPATNAVIQCNTEEYDTLNEYNTGTYLFTATAAGKYHVIGQYWFGSAGLGTTEFGELELQKNSSTAVLRSDKMNGSGDSNRLVRCKVVGTLQLAAGDTLRLRHLGSNAIRDIPAGSAYTYFEIHRVG